MKVSERLEKIPPYLFAEIDRKIAEARAKGIDIISLGIGDPDTPTLQPVVDEMHKAIDNPKNHDYPPYNGVFEDENLSAYFEAKLTEIRSVALMEYFNYIPCPEKKFW